MKSYVIRENEAGQRFDKYLGKLLKEAPMSFTYKMLRKKNITLNGKKADGTEKLKAGDEVKLFLSDETYEKFAGHVAPSAEVKMLTKTEGTQKLNILYEDEDVLLINKPTGMLSQSTGDGTPSLNEYLIAYLLESEKLTEEEMRTFRPSACNRLDRNTSGIIAAGKSLKGLQDLSRVFHDRTVRKDYLTIVSGVIKSPSKIKGYLQKDEKENKVTIYKEKVGDALPIETEYTPLGNNGNSTLLKVHLITGRAHQIRAHLATMGHPVFGDHKYGTGKETHHLKSQLLHSYRLEFPTRMEQLHQLEGKVYYAELPAAFEKIIKKEKLEKYLPKEK